MVCWCLGLVAGLVFAIGAYKIFLKKDKKGPPELVVKNWERGVVYIIQLPVSPHCHSASPFAIKLETWLRLAKVKYEPRFSLKRSSRKQSPFIELDGQQYPDSNHIIDMLKKRGIGVDPDEVAGVKDDKERMSVAHMARIMVESHTALFGFYWRYAQNTEECFRKVFAYYGLISWWPASWIFQEMFRREFIPRYYKIGIARHTDEQREDLSCRDLKALEDIAKSGNDRFFLGTTVPSSVDCMLFGHLVQLLYIPMDFPQKKFLHARCPQLVSLVDRVRDRLWPDWEAACQEEYMQGRRF